MVYLLIKNLQICTYKYLVNKNVVDNYLLVINIQIYITHYSLGLGIVAIGTLKEGEGQDNRSRIHDTY